MKKAAAWAIVLIFLALPCHAAMNFQVDGQVGIRAQYTPESSFQIDRRVYLNSILDVGQRIKGRIGFEGLGSSESWQPINTLLGNFKLNVDRLTLYTISPLYPGGENALVSIGDLELNYSPYALRIDDTTWYEGQRINPRKRGLSIADYYLALPGGREAMMDLCALWDQDKSNRFLSELWDFPQQINLKNNTQVYALHLRFGQRGAGSELTAVKSTGTVDRIEETNTFQRFNFSEETLVFQQKKTEGNFLWSAICGSNKRQYDYKTSFVAGVETDQALAPVSSAGSLVLAELAYKLRPVEVAIGYQYIQPEFDPEYRDRTPRYDKEGKRLAWNPIDKLTTTPGVIYGTYQQMFDPSYKIGRKGGYVSLDGNLGKGKLSGVYNWFRGLNDNPLEETSYQLFTGQVFMPIGSNTVSCYYEQVRQNIARPDGAKNSYPTRYFSVKAERPVAIKDNYTLGLLGSYEYEDLFASSDYTKQRGAFLVLEATGGRWAGLKAKAGVLREDYNALQEKTVTRMAKASVAYSLPTGISILANWSQPNRPDSRLYDRFGQEYLGADNLLEARLEMEF